MITSAKKLPKNHLRHRFYIMVLFQLMLLFCYAAGQSLKAATILSATSSQDQIPTHMLAGQRYQISLTLENRSSATWSLSNGYTLTFAKGKRPIWGINQVNLKANEKVPPGASKIFQFSIKAPSTPGLYDFQWQMTKNGTSLGEPTKNLSIVVETPNTRVKFISQVVPTNMKAGKSYTAFIQYRNLGNTIWSKANNHQLGARATNKLWGISSIPLTANSFVAEGEIATFRFTVVAPAKAGTYDFRWQMKRGSNRWFGEPTPNLRIKVEAQNNVTASEFVFQKLPGLQKAGKYFSILEAGKVYPVTITFKNTGTTTWTNASYQLTSQNPIKNMTWTVDQVNLRANDTIKPSDFKTFNFKIITPLEPGIYDFQWQMHAKHMGWFGALSDNVSVTVR